MHVGFVTVVYSGALKQYDGKACEKLISNAVVDWIIISPLSRLIVDSSLPDISI